MKKHPKTIAFLIHGLKSGGAERVLTTLANSFVEHYNVLVITQKKTEVFYTLHPDVKVVSCFNRLNPSTNFFQALKTNFELYRRVLRYLGMYRVDLCIGFITTSNVIAVLAAKTKGIPVIISERNFPPMEDRKISGFWKKLRSLTYPRATKLVVQTNGIREFFYRMVPGHKIEVIPNPLNPELASNHELPREKIILNVGRLDPQKDQKSLILAFSHLETTNWKLVILGEGNERQNLEKLIDELGLNEQVVLPGRSSQMADWYSRSAIFAFTSIYEGFPNALMEAMHFGLSCVATDCPTGPSELIKSGKNGLLVPVGDVDEIAASLKKLIRDASFRRELGRAAEKTMASYSIEKISDKWLRLANKTLKPK